MEVFIERAVGKIRKTLSRRDKDKELRESCDEVLSHLKAGTPHLSEETYFAPLFCAILTKHSSKTTCLALDCIEKLLAFGYMRGTAPITSSLQAHLQRTLNLREDDMNMTAKHSVLLIDAVVEVVCSCQDHNDTDVQLQVLKAVLTAVTSTSCAVQEHFGLTCQPGGIRPQAVGDVNGFPSLWHKDAYLVFRALCRISMRFVIDDAIGDAADDQPQTGEMEIFITNIFLRILDSENSTFEHKMLVLEVLNHICDDQLILSEIFLNYDCDWDSMDLFKRIVNALAKIAKAKQRDSIHASAPAARQLKMQQNEAALVLKGRPHGTVDTHAARVGLECMTSTVHSLKKAANFVSITDQGKPSPTGIVKFNVKATDGIKFCTANNLVENTPRKVAEYLHEYNARLDKFQVCGTGSMGCDRWWWCRRTIAELGAVDPKSVGIVAKTWLQDLHNPSIPDEKKMTKEGFLRNNRGINNGEDLAAEYLGGIFDRIKSTPISLKEEQKLKRDSSTVSGAVLDKQRKDAYSREREAMVRAVAASSEAFFKRRSPSSRLPMLHPDKSPAASSSAGLFHVVSGSAEHVKPMFEIVWAPLLAVCSVIFESSDHPVAIQYCLDGFKHAIHLSARYDSIVLKSRYGDGEAGVGARSLSIPFTSNRLQMLSERDAYVSVLANFTAVQHSATRPIGTKQIEAIKTLIAIAVKEGNFLGDAWTLSEDQLVAMEAQNAQRIADQIDGLASDRVFSNSRYLTDASVQEFVQQLCIVSLSECQGPCEQCQSFMLSIARVTVGLTGSGMTVRMAAVATALPRVFSLQKLVEVADMNMHVRSRFLEKDELRDFNFQRLFLTPFEIIMGNAVSVEIRELVLRYLTTRAARSSTFFVCSCVHNMIMSRVDSIKSGWKTIWGVLRVAAETFDVSEHDTRVVLMGFALAKTIVDCHFDRVVGAAPSLVFGLYWAKAVAIPRVEWARMVDVSMCRDSALVTLYGSLHSNGAAIDASLWHVLLRDLLVPLMDSIRQVEMRDTESVSRASSKKALLALVTLYGTFYPSIGHVDDVLDLLQRWIVLESEDQLARAAAIAYETLLVEHGHQFPPAIWELITAELQTIQSRLLPLWLIEPTRDPATLTMYPSVSAILFPSPAIQVAVPSHTHMDVLLDTQRICGNVLVQVVHTSLPPHCFDAILVWKPCMPVLGWRYGCQSAKELPHMLAQEIMGKREYLKAVSHHLPRYRDEFTSLVETTLQEYLQWSSQDGDAMSQSMDLRQRSYGYVPLIVDILEELAVFSTDEVRARRRSGLMYA
ncbi:hypothetical protein DYB32_002736 [Aphanomyces invadans]|uniref:SEC7 domain-containing protein n=1 Tax=Aphanomyces invadans TaxID=157072 RepID=A0A3R6VQ06_9STRA|nr:hypothetical protein DYB32_002736 [Aphanomyces invadans]